MKTMRQKAAALESTILALGKEIAYSQKRLDALKQSLASALEKLAYEKETDMPVDLNKTRPARQFDWLKAHLGWYDKIAPGSPDMDHMTQETWEALLGDGIDRYVVTSTSFMGREIPLDYLPSEKQ